MAVVGVAVRVAVLAIPVVAAPCLPGVAFSARYLAGDSIRAALAVEDVVVGEELVEAGDVVAVDSAASAAAARILVGPG